MDSGSGIKETLKTNYTSKKKKKSAKKMAFSLILPEHKGVLDTGGPEGLVKKTKIYGPADADTSMSDFKSMSSEEKSEEAARYFKRRANESGDEDDKQRSEEAIKSYIKLKKKKKQK